MRIKYLNVEDAIELHDMYVQRVLGCLPGIRDRNILVSSIDQIKQVVFGTELYPTLEEKAARLCYSIVKNHPFNDGNKRVALLCTLDFLELNGYKISSSKTDNRDHKFGNLINDVAASKKDEDDIIDFISNDIVKIK